MGPLSIRCVLTEPELRAALRDMARRSSAPKIALIIAVLWAVFGVAGLIRSPGMRPAQGSPGTRIALCVGPPLFLGVWVLSFVWRQPRKRARFMAAHSPNLETALRISDGEVEIEGREGRTVLYWKALRTWRELPDLLLLNLHTGNWVLIPKKSFASSADLERVRALFTDKLGAPLS
jgi:hypothetical protein